MEQLAVFQLILHHPPHQACLQSRLHHHIRPPGHSLELLWAQLRELRFLQLEYFSVTGVGSVKPVETPPRKALNSPG
jgi:hypothetical protein